MDSIAEVFSRCQYPYSFLCYLAAQSFSFSSYAASQKAHCYKNWLIDVLWKGLRGGHIKKPSCLMLAINRGGHFLLTEVVKNTASQNILSEVVVLLTGAVKTTASVNKTTTSDNIFCDAVFLTASVNKKWPSRLIAGINRGGFLKCPPPRPFLSTSQNKTL